MTIWQISTSPMRIVENPFYKKIARLKCSGVQSVPISGDSCSKIFYKNIFKCCQISEDINFYSLSQCFTITVLIELCLHELIYLEYYSNWIIMFLQL